MTTTIAKPAREPAAAKPEQTRRIGHDVGTLAVDAYERGVANLVAFEKDAAKIARSPWAKNALTLSAELIEGVNAACVKTARHALR
ncbi:hypothetical protein EV385_5137 [Krasilnikovia cinnamomea]|uniref:Uncharacterized protein n=1 Tax=Krasilnikovia cinnamomea TaxID=349313 RepID=A0A4V2G7N2_9ACTN|nr:hypothetical protein [Krasilnikovia cinnamomea]RZU53236.1 hypothetical protein EV385_5137 [Krasilnikovia cinnamomea]